MRSFQLGGGGGGGAGNMGLQQVDKSERLSYGPIFTHLLNLKVYHSFDLFGTKVDITLEKILMLVVVSVGEPILAHSQSERLISGSQVFFLGGAQFALAIVALFVGVTYLNSRNGGSGGTGQGGATGRAGGNSLR